MISWAERLTRTPLHLAERRLLDQDRVRVEQGDDVERVGANDLDARQVPGGEDERLVRGRCHDQDATVGPTESIEDADQVARLRLLETELVEDADRVVVELRRERSAQGEALHLARQTLCIAARVRPEDHAAASELRGPRGALARPTGPLLAIRLPTAAGDLATLLGVVGPEVAAGQLGGHHLVEHGRVDRRREELFRELHLADLLARPRVQGRLGHR